MSGIIRDFSQENRKVLLDGVLYDCVDNHFTSQNEIDNFGTEVTELVPETSSDFFSIFDFFEGLRRNFFEMIEIIGQVLRDVDASDLMLREMIQGAKREAEILLVALQGLNQLLDGGTGLNRSSFEFRQIAENVMLRVEVERTLDVMFPVDFNGERQVCWDTLQEVMSRPYADISEAEFMVLAWIFTSIESIENQERFLNLLADPIVSVYGENGVTVTVYATRIPIQDVTMFQICPDKVWGIQRNIEVAISTILSEQMQIGRGNDGYSNLDDRRRNYIQRSALLGIIGDLTPKPLEGSVGESARRPLLQARNGEIFPFNLRSAEYPHLYRLSFISVATSDITYQGRSGLTFRDIDLHQSQNPTLYITPVRQGGGVQSLFENLASLELTQKHEFNLVAYGVNALAMYGVNKTIEQIFGKGASVFVSLVAGAAVAAEKAHVVQQDINTVVSHLQEGAFHTSFDLTAVTVTDGRGSWEVISWPSSGTSKRFEDLNTIVADMGENALCPLLSDEEKEIFRVAAERLSESTQNINDVLNIFVGLEDAAREKLN